MAATLNAMEANDRYKSLGPEFLTWLYVHIQGEDLPAPESEPGLKISMLGPVVMTSETGEATKMSLAGEEAAAAPELRSGLKAGKRIAQARLQFEVHGDTWVFSLHGETFDFRGMKLPVPKIADADESLAMRVQATQRLSLLVGEMFEAFLLVRLDPAAWKQEAARWKKLATGGK